MHVQDEANSLTEIITPRASPYDCIVEIDGKMAYKANLLKKLTASNHLSTLTDSGSNNILWPVCIKVVTRNVIVLIYIDGKL